MFIFDEKLYAENMIRDGPKDFIPYKDLKILAKYYRHIGNNEKETKFLVFEFCKKQTGFNEIIQYERIMSAINQGKKQNLRIPVNIPITVNEINRIREIKNYRLEKILFVILVTGKYRRLTNISKKENLYKNYFVDNKMSEHLRLAHVSEKKGEYISGILHDAGYLDTIETTDSIIIKYANTEDDSDIFVLITDISNIISFYKPYCEMCGKELIKNSNSHKLCRCCWEQKRRNDINNNSKKYYQNKILYK